jgi:hypothetical protein
MPGSTPPRFASVARLLATVALTLFVSTLAYADSFSFSNTDGDIKITNNAFTLTGSEIGLLNGQPVSGYSLSFATSTDFTGSLGTGGSWAAGGSLTIRASGSIIFQGTFSGPVTWTLEPSSGCAATSGSCEYQLSGDLAGTYYANGKGNGPGSTIIAGSTTQIDLTTHNSGYYTGVPGTLSDKGGSTNLVTTVPEPGSLGLMGTGFLGLVAVLRRKFKGLESSPPTSL